MSTVLRSLCVCAFLATSSSALSHADDKPGDSKSNERRTEWLWMNAEGGVEAANLTTFNANSDTLTVGLTPTSGVGPTVGLGAGFRLFIFTLGARGRLGVMQPGASNAWQLWTLDAEAGIRIPLGRFEPYLTLSGGYASLGNFGQAISGLGSGLDISGANVRAGGGLDFYITHGFSVGGAITGEMLVLGRPGVSLRDLAAAKQVGTINEAQARVLEANGTSVGGALTFTLGVGLHL